MSETSNKAIETISAFFDLLEAELDLASAEGRCVPTTGFAKDNCEKFGWTWTAAYHLIGVYALTRKDDLTLKLGPNGGLTRRKQR